MRRSRTGWDLTKKSWRLLRGQPGLTAYPIVGGLLSLVLFVVPAGLGLYLLDTDSSVLGYVLIAIGVYLASLAATFFGVGLAAAADRAFKGEPVSLSTGVAVASGRFGAIAGWAFVSAVIGTAISLLQSQRGLAGPILGALGGAAWGLITFLAIPVIAIEGTGPIETIRRSAHLFRERWRGQVTGNVAIGGAVALFGILPSVLLIVLGLALWSNDGGGDAVALGAVLTLIGAAILCVSIVISQALRQVFGIALYRYTADGDVVAGFTEAELASAVKTRGG
ncbi:MAG TPA: DUF6159 family protein [Thermoleophilaceae bacterium]|nr:DUF6159 family protein [Thermoleophilaceae bacterium]